MDLYDYDSTMKRAEHFYSLARGVNRLKNWPLLCGILCLALTPVRAALDYYVNNSPFSYPGNASSLPQIDATNFVNVSTFILNYTAALGSTPLIYETSDTVNYTNTDVMMENIGYQFDTQSSGTGLRTTAGSFYNAGTIDCGTAADTNDPFGGVLYEFGYYPQCLVNATNILVPGTINTGPDGRIQLDGQNVELARSVLSIAGGASVYATGVNGLNTNAWDPSLELGLTNAITPVFPIFPGQLALYNSISYIHQDVLGPSNVVTRAVFIEDTSPTNVYYNVYFGNNGIGTGTATIEWIGSYQDPVTGNYSSNYLYLNDDYLEGIATNLPYNNNGLPENFTVQESTVPLINATPAPVGFMPYPPGGITNIYVFADINVLSTSESTNQIANGAISNFLGRVEISATNDLDLSYSQITGLNYLSLQATNQFDGSVGASIEAPYSDISLGVTNGFLTISNLMTPTFLDWSGNIQAWSTRWLEVDSTGVTNDYRVLIVGSQLDPTTLAQVQNMMLHGTNLVISDSLNIFGSFSADAQNLTVTTNGIGVGATSQEGELNINNPGIFFGSSLPNLRNFTNNGAIQFGNLAQLIANSNNVSVTPPIPAVAASATLSEVAGRANVQAGNGVIIGTNRYVFEPAITNTAPGQVEIAATFDSSLTNLIAAINRTAGAGTVYTTSTSSNGLVSAGPLSLHAFTVTALTTGTNGNLIAVELSLSTTNLVWAGTTVTVSDGLTNYGLAGGVDMVPGVTNVLTINTPYFNFINDGLFVDQGSTIWANNFVNGGTVDNGPGNFTLTSQATTLTNGLIIAGGDISIATGNLTNNNATLQAARSLTLQVTNLLTDGVLPYAGGTNSDVVTNGSFWTVGSSTATTGGFGLLVDPAAGDLLGTSITNICPANKLVVDAWAGQDRGYSLSGYTNNAAVGKLILDALGSPTNGTQFEFQGVNASPATTNALYVDELQLLDYSTNYINGVITNVLFNTTNNLIIYYAQALADGVSVAEQINHFNNDHFRWVSNYAGYFSSTNILYPDGNTYTFNAALAQSHFISSNGSGTPNANNPTPFFVASEINFGLTLTNTVPPKASLTWNSIPSSTNYVYYKTNLMSTNWILLTNFVSPSAVPPVGGWPIVNVLSDPLTNQARFYQLREDVP